MDKEKILEMSRKENLLNDEREIYITKSANDWGLALMSLVLIILTLIASKFGFDITAANVLFWSFIFGRTCYILLKRFKEFTAWKKAINLMIALGSLILLVTSIVDLIKY